MSVDFRLSTDNIIKNTLLIFIGGCGRNLREKYNPSLDSILISSDSTYIDKNYNCYLEDRILSLRNGR